MNDSVMGIAIELYNNPQLLEVMKLAMELNKQDIENIITYLENAKKVREQ